MFPLLNRYRSFKLAWVVRGFRFWVKASGFHADELVLPSLHDMNGGAIVDDEVLIGVGKLLGGPSFGTRRGCQASWEGWPLLSTEPVDAVDACPGRPVDCGLQKLRPGPVDLGPQSWSTASSSSTAARLRRNPLLATRTQLD